MAETLAQKRTRHHNERIAARECIARIEAILAIGGCGQTDDQLAPAKIKDIRAVIVDYNKEIV